MHTHGAAPLGAEDDAGFEALKRKIHRERGFNCHFYKDRCLRRRVAVRMRARGESDLGRYADLLDHDPAEYDRLLAALTINVSKFFRNPETWATLEHEVVPWLLDPAGGEHDVWSAGCAGGEEAYTLSILLHEWARRHDRERALRRVRILGTDIDAGSLRAAEAALYPELALVDTPDALRRRWFSPGPPYRLADEARTRVRFRRHDLLSEPPPERQSLILCRNVIIYFDRQSQDQLFQRFHQALVPGGVLVLGKVETLLGPARGLFEPLSSRERVFRRRA